MTGALIKGHLNTDMHTESTPCEDEGRDWEDALISQETLTIAAKPAKTRAEAGRTFLHDSLKESTLPTPCRRLSV